MGGGTPIDLLEAVHRGVDMFDCILPVEQAQRGVAFTSIGKLQMRRGIYKLDDTALDPNCQCPCCFFRLKVFKILAPLCERWFSKEG